MSRKILLFFSLWMSACQQPAQELSNEQKRYIAVQSKHKIDSLGAIQDSLCLQHYEQKVAAARDSLFPIRLREVALRRRSQLQHRTQQDE